MNSIILTVPPSFMAGPVECDYGSGKGSGEGSDEGSGKGSGEGSGQENEIAR